MVAFNGPLGMADYRCYCQDREDQIVSRYDISAPDLDAALREARWFCGIYSVEIWQGIVRVYPLQDTPGGAGAGK
jgi:hypothetical protein